MGVVNNIQDIKSENATRVAPLEPTAGKFESISVLANNHHESADFYRRVLFRSGSYRVAICKDGLQWLFQRRRSGKTGVAAAWDTLGFCTTRKSLIRLHRSYSGRDMPDLRSLPENFKREAQK